MSYSLILTGCLIGFISGYVYRARGVPFIGKWGTPFIGKARKYTIGIYTGTSMKNFSAPDGVINPVLSPEDVNDVHASFVADPFLYRYCDRWFMFMEVMNRSRNLGEIGYATSNDGLIWSYKSIVLSEEFHLSYPFVFEYNGEIWMIPETSKKSSVRLYRATDFPTKWNYEMTLIEGFHFTDASVFQHDGSWWMFVSRNISEDLLLYFSDKLTGPWYPHPKSPVVYAKPDMARCAGRPIHFNGRLIRFAQDSGKEYGRAVRAFWVQQLDRTDFIESEIEESPILYPAEQGWNSKGMHHIDLQVLKNGSYLAAVDGLCIVRDYGLQY